MIRKKRIRTESYLVLPYRISILHGLRGQQRVPTQQSERNGSRKNSKATVPASQ